MLKSTSSGFRRLRIVVPQSSHKQVSSYWNSGAAARAHEQFDAQGCWSFSGAPDRYSIQEHGSGDCSRHLPLSAPAGWNILLRANACHRMRIVGRDCSTEPFSTGAAARTVDACGKKKAAVLNAGNCHSSSSSLSSRYSSAEPNSRLCNDTPHTHTTAASTSVHL